MISDIVLDRLRVGTDGFLKLKPSRCTRMRFAGSTCQKCRSACDFNAISYKGGPRIEEERCSGCLHCTAECPTGALYTQGVNFFGIMNELKESPAQVLGCSAKSDTKANARVPCLSMISAEHLLFMAVFLKRLVQFNLTECASCNGHTEHAVRKKIEALQAAIGEEEVLLQAISDELHLSYKETEVDRRGFFSVLRTATRRSAAQLISGGSESSKVVAYGDKELPFKRHILNTILEVSGEELRKKILSMYYYSASCSGCNVCGACVGVCPTGALKMYRKEGIKRLLFDTSQCCGCMVCDEFCPQHVLSVAVGYRGVSPFSPDSIADSRQKDGGEI